MKYKEIIASLERLFSLLNGVYTNSIVYVLLGVVIFSCSTPQKHIDTSPIRIQSANDAIAIFPRLAFFIEVGNREFDYKRLKSANFRYPDTLRYYVPEGTFKSKTIWMRCVLKNDTPDDLSYYYVLKHAYLYKGTVFLVTDDEVQQLHTYSYHHIDRTHRYSNFPTWKIPIAKNSKVAVYIKVHETGGRTRVSSVLKGERDFLDYLITTFGMHAAFVLFVLLIVCIAIYVSQYTKQRYVLFYALYMLSLCIDYLSVHGIGQSYLWTDSYFLLRNARSMSNAASGLFLCLFFASFYNFHQYSVWVRRVFQATALVFGIFIGLYVVKFFAGGLSSLFLYVWKTISFFSVVLITVHSYLAIKKLIPLYLPIVFIMHLGVAYVNANYIFSYSSNVIWDWVLMNILYISFSIEVLVWTYFIFHRLKKEKAYLQELEAEVIQLQEKLDALKNKKQDMVLVNELIHLKSKAILNSADILYVKSDGHYVEYHLDTKEKPEIDRNSLTEVLQQLPSSSFVRTHKSYIVNIYRIKIINSTKLMLDNGIWLNLSRTYKQQLKDRLHHGE